MSRIRAAWAVRLASMSVAVLGIAIPTSGFAAQAEWPTRQITFYVGFAVGGFADSVARVIGDRLSKRLKQSVVVENMDGAGGNIAARQVATSPPDGYSLLVTTTSLAINATLYAKKGFTVAGLTPVAIPLSAPESLVSDPKSDIHSLKDFAAQAKAGTLYVATPGIGTGSHIAVEYFFKILAKLKAKDIPFPGGAPALQGLLAGDANVMASTATAATISGIKSGELLGLAVASSERDQAIPNVPTFAEQGYPGFLASSWTGFFAPAGTPEPVLRKLNAEINEAVRDPQVKKAIDTLGLLTVIRSREATDSSFKADVARWGDMVKATGVAM